MKYPDFYSPILHQSYGRIEGMLAAACLPGHKSIYSINSAKLCGNNVAATAAAPVPKLSELSCVGSNSGHGFSPGTSSFAPERCRHLRSKSKCPTTDKGWQIDSSAS